MTRCRRLLPLALGGIVGLFSSFARAGENPLPTAASVDLERYLGSWYEVARLPARFEKDCAGVTATYSRRDDGSIEVRNRCVKGALGGEAREAKGTAKVTDDKSNAKLKVTFFWPFWGDYWILEVGSDYEYALVGEPDRDYLWILSRTPVLPEPKVEQLLTRARSLGFDTSKIIRTLQDASAPAFKAPRSGSR